MHDERQILPRKNGPAVRLPIAEQPHGTFLVPIGTFWGNVGAAGRTYILEKQEGAWVIIGTTGVEWVS